MRRSQVMIEDEQYYYLVDEAKRTGKSISALLREWIDERRKIGQRLPLDQDPLWDMVGIARGGRDSVSEQHDRYLAHARLRRMPRKRSRGNKIR